MNIGVIGLGRMGNAIAFRLLQAGHTVYGFDVNLQMQEQAAAMGVIMCKTLGELAQEVQIFWIMVPAEIVGSVVNELKQLVNKHSIIIDGGNSYFEDSIARAKELLQDHIYYLDVGTSGGVHGRTHGFSLMIGGQHQVYAKAEELFKAIAAPDGYGYVGPSGAGHYVKMIHNGIEYALLQAYAQGFDVLKHGRYKNLDLQEISRIWMHGSIIRSFILELVHAVFVQQGTDFDTVSGKVGGGQTGRWTVQEAQRFNISVSLIEQALKIRDESQKTGGDYATKLVALLRNQFGDHPVEYINENN